jgi:hypothetical protein
MISLPGDSAGRKIGGGATSHVSVGMDQRRRALIILFGCSELAQATMGHAAGMAGGLPSPPPHLLLFTA